MNVVLDQTFEHALALQNANDLAGARGLYSQILKRKPEHIPSLMNLGSICYATQEYQLALNLYSVVLKISPSCADALYSRGCVHQLMDKLMLAEQDYRTCLKLEPHKTVCLENLIAMLSGRETSLQECTRLVEKRLQVSRDLNYLLILAQYKAESGKAQEADRLYREVLDLSPANAVANYFVATQQLIDGQFEKGISGLQHRWSIPGFLSTNPAKVIPLKKWQHESLAGKKLFVSAEQGVGDGVMFASSIPDLREEADLIVMECDPRMSEIYRRSFPNVELIEAVKTVMDTADVNWRELDYYSSLADLHGTYYKPQNSHRWLEADPLLGNKWTSWLKKFSGFKIGISWCGGFGSKQIDKHSIDLSEFMSIFSEHNTTLISLQYNPDLADIEEINSSSTTTIQVPPDLDCRNDLNSLFALIDQLDLIITIDNCTAYFAASLGRPVWVLLPLTRDWRWDLAREVAGWQSSIRQFRNSKAADWSELIVDVHSALQEFSPAERRPGTMNQSEREPKSSIQQRHFMKKLLLINDSINWHHWGYSCAGVSMHQNLQEKGYRVTSYPASAISQMRAFPLTLDQFNDTQLLQGLSVCCRELLEVIKTTDIVVINGEGSEHTGGSMLLLYLGFVAKQAFNKNVRLLNHSFFTQSPDPAQFALFQNIYHGLDHIVSSNELSLDLCQKMGASGTAGFSCLPLSIRDLFSDIPRGSKINKIILGASDADTTDQLESVLNLIMDSELQRDFQFEFLLGSRAYLSAQDEFLVQALTARSPGNFSIRFCTSESEWLSQIAHSKLLVSDRLHHSIAAACLGTPFLLYPGHNQSPFISMLGVSEEVDFVSQCRRSLTHPDESTVSIEQIHELQSLAENNFRCL